MDRVIEKIKLNQVKADAMLKLQVVKVFTAICETMQKEEEEHRCIHQRLQASESCSMGVSWYRCGGVWFYTGGSHYKSDGSLGRSWTGAFCSMCGTLIYCVGTFRVWGEKSFYASFLFLV